MTDLSSRAAHLLAELQAVADIRAFDPEGQQTINNVFETLPAADLNYGTTVTYLLQQIHGHHFPGITDHRGYYFSPDEGKSVCPFTIAPRPYDGCLSVVVTSPRGTNAVACIVTLEKLVHEIDAACAFYIRKPPASLSPEITARQRSEVTPWNDKAYYEDDTYPNVIVDVGSIADEVSLDGEFLWTKQGKPYVKLKQQLRGLERRLALYGKSINQFQLVPFVEGKDMSHAENIITNFFSEKDTRGHLSKPIDYFNLFNGPVSWRDANNTIRAFLSFEGVKLGLVSAERIGNSNYFGIYSLLVNQPPVSLMPEHVNISELQTVLLLTEIYRRGGRFADLGGAETPSLQHHHLKYVPEKKEKPEMQPVTTAPWLQLG